MESLWEIHIRITAWCIEIRCWNLAGCFILPSTWSTRKSFSVRQRRSSAHIKFWDTLFISETIRARKLKFGILVGICRYYSCMLQVLCKIKQPAKFQRRMRICTLANCKNLYVPKTGILGVLRVKMWKFCVLTPNRHYPAWIRVCWCIVCQNRMLDGR